MLFFYGFFIYARIHYRYFDYRVLAAVAEYRVQKGHQYALVLILRKDYLEYDIIDYAVCQRLFLAFNVGGSLFLLPRLYYTTPRRVFQVHNA